mmetsp:Transcript_15142/g.35984  ORF Transcript_15142/g.35984 Transcript_15142/m.35984 type:complete len:651 (+) Transcript_15142:326-2278(+)
MLLRAKLKARTLRTWEATTALSACCTIAKAAAHSFRLKRGMRAFQAHGTRAAVATATAAAGGARKRREAMRKWADLPAAAAAAAQKHTLRRVAMAAAKASSVVRGIRALSASTSRRHLKAAALRILLKPMWGRARAEVSQLARAGASAKLGNARRKGLTAEALGAWQHAARRLRYERARAVAMARTSPVPGRIPAGPSRTLNSATGLSAATGFSAANGFPVTAAVVFGPSWTAAGLSGSAPGLSDPLGLFRTAASVPASPPVPPPSPPPPREAAAAAGGLREGGVRSVPVGREAALDAIREAVRAGGESRRSDGVRNSSDSLPGVSAVSVVSGVGSRRSSFSGVSGVLGVGSRRSSIGSQHGALPSPPPGLPSPPPGLASSPPGLPSSPPGLSSSPIRLAPLGEVAGSSSREGGRRRSSFTPPSPSPDFGAAPLEGERGVRQREGAPALPSPPPSSPPSPSSLELGATPVQLAAASELWRARGMRAGVTALEAAYVQAEVLKLAATLGGQHARASTLRAAFASLASFAARQGCARVQGGRAAPSGLGPEGRVAQQPRGCAQPPPQRPSRPSALSAGRPLVRGFATPVEGARDTLGQGDCAAQSERRRPPPLTTIHSGGSEVGSPRLPVSPDSIALLRTQRPPSVLDRRRC